MLYKTGFLIPVCLLLAATLSAQMKNSGAIRVNANTYFVLTDDFTNLSGGKLDNNGNFQCRSLNNNSGATLSGSGKYTVGKNWTNAGAFSGNSTVVFSGSEVASITPGGAVFYKVELNKTGSVNVGLAGSMRVNSDLKFTGANNHLVLGIHDLTIGIGATITSSSSTKYVVTGATGQLLKINSDAATFLFPVGYDVSTYNPLTITNTPTSVAFGVRCLSKPLTSGGSGTALPANAVNASWQVTQASGGTPSLDLTAQWVATDEQTTFNRSLCAVRRFNGTTWDSSPFGAAPGTGPYTRKRIGISAVGYFAVLDNDIPSGSTEEGGAKPTEAPPAAALPAQESLQLFPNPTTGLLSLRLAEEGQAQVRILDFQGNAVLEKALTERLSRLDVSALPNGTYFLEVLSETGQRQVKKFLKQGF